MSDAERAAFLALLSKLEWSATKRYDHHDSSACCPICRSTGVVWGVGDKLHEKDCELAHVLAVLKFPGDF